MLCIILYVGCSICIIQGRYTCIYHHDIDVQNNNGQWTKPLFAQVIDTTIETNVGLKSVSK
jgi:hypothetical protein